MFPDGEKFVKNVEYLKKFNCLRCEKYKHTSPEHAEYAEIWTVKIGQTEEELKSAKKRTEEKSLITRKFAFSVRKCVEMLKLKKAICETCEISFLKAVKKSVQNVDPVE